MSANTDTKKAARGTASDTGFSAEEKAAMKERAKELKAQERMGKDRDAGEKAVLEKIAEMPEPDRGMATRLHEIVKENAPDLMPRTWYGMPAYTRDGKVVCFFQAKSKFDARYASFGFDDTATLDEGDMWPTYFAIKEMTPAVQARIAALIKKAVG